MCFAPLPRRPRLRRRRRRRLHRQLLEALWRCCHVRRDDVTDLPRADARAEHVLVRAESAPGRRRVDGDVAAGCKPALQERCIRSCAWQEFLSKLFSVRSNARENKLSELTSRCYYHMPSVAGRPLSIRASAPRTYVVHTRAQVDSRLGARHRDKRNIVIRRALGIATPRPNAPRVSMNARRLVSQEPS